MNDRMRSMQPWTTLPTDEVIEKTAEALTKNGLQTVVVETKEQAKETVLALLPDGAEVMDMTSVTLVETGIHKELLHSGRFHPVKKTLESLHGKEKRQLGAAPDYAIGSVHAVTEDGSVVIASNSGSQLPAYASGAAHVIWVVGAQKIVKNVDEGLKRIYDYVLPLESERARKAYGVEGSNVSKLLIITRENKPHRITLILIKEPIGY